jgi:hypothetical protein
VRVPESESETVMDKIDKYNFVDLAVGILDKRQSENPQSAILLDHRGDEVDGWFCLDCVKKRRRKPVAGENFLYAGYIPEEDHSNHCERCGALLDYTLTDYGVDNELSHFVENGFDWNHPQSCYELARVAHGMLKNDRRYTRELFKVLRNGKNLPKELAAILPQKARR